ncbi:MAG TPA: hypothetical protein DCX07_07125, partial [Phycisphaerales bacterium]|nr:hypothetical protein [Phycisphaerales bacterium]
MPGGPADARRRIRQLARLAGGFRARDGRRIARAARDIRTGGPRRTKLARRPGFRGRRLPRRAGCPDGRPALHSRRAARAGRDGRRAVRLPRARPRVRLGPAPTQRELPRPSPRRPVRLRIHLLRPAGAGTVGRGDGGRTVTADPRIRATLDETRRRLLAARTAGGAWRGELSSSALATATAVAALATIDPRAHAAPLARGVRWLVEHANADGGWGDTPQSRSNLPTTTLVWSALAMSPDGEKPSALLARCEAYLAERCGGLSPGSVARAIVSQYGQDRTFSAPILAMCALAGRLGNRPRDAWALVPQLPFELGILPHDLLRAARLPVVSYALPALIAVGQARDRFRPVACPLTRAVRRLVARASLNRLERLQPPGGGFLEAVPLTSFVAMCLAAMDLRNHPVVARSVAFLLAAQRADGSWPIDTDLAGWVTSLSVRALGPDGLAALDPSERNALRSWLLRCQLRARHVFTGASPGGWAWTDQPGGVPDADDTAGALLALHALD